MPIKDKDRKARANYQKKVKYLNFAMYPTDEDIKERLEECRPATTYIKRLIREDIARSKAEQGNAEDSTSD